MTAAPHTTHRQVDTASLEIAYFDIGPVSAAPPVILLHGFPYDALACEAAADRLARAGRRCIVPYLRGFGPTRFRTATTQRSGQQAALAADLLELMDALQIERAVLAGFDWGGRAACIAAALWPERVVGLVSCGPAYNIQDIANASQPADPETERRFWYQYYFHSERGRAGLAVNRSAFCRLLWRLWSPTWRFSNATFGRSARAFENPDFVEVVIHSYRHRFGLADGDPQFSDIERRLAAQPPIEVPTIILQGADDGVDPPAPTGEDRLSQLLARRVLPRVGHNPPQEQPDTFVQAVLDIDRLRPVRPGPSKI